ncbi:MAG: hypothetical protein GY749_13705 [Desulfobacteraceae bacterium]|nr:hypothetical protein [Desulfobacteraceae bacterium]
MNLKKTITLQAVLLLLLLSGCTRQMYVGPDKANFDLLETELEFLKQALKETDWKLLCR